MMLCPAVMSAGGAKGAFGAGAELRCHERGWRWNKISAVSIGALNGCFISMNQRTRLRDFWMNVSPKQVLVTPSAGAVALRVSRKKPSLYPIKGVASFVDQVDPSLMQIEVRVGAVSLLTGEYKIFTNGHPSFKQALLASCAMPMIFPPVDIDEDNLCMTDGAVRNYSPLSDLIPDGDSHIMIINCMSSEVLPSNHAPRTALAVAQRALDIAMHEIQVKDIDKTRRVNRMVEQAEAVGLTLVNTEGRPFRKVDVTVIEPESWIADIVEYNAKNAKRAYDAGYEKARQVIG